jgi:cytochrome b subunit of formate dehydrogenase
VVFRRFGRLDRVCHSVLIVAFLGLVMTGLPLKYNETGWAKRVAYWLGGFDATSAWHRIFALTLFSLLALYVARLVRSYLDGRRRGMTARQVIFGPESPVPNRRDGRDFLKMLRWFVGLGPKPSFERWAYWEKLDFWAAQADIVIIGLTGLVLWFPHFFTAFLPALSINIAKVVHSTQALLATGFVFAVHLFNTQLRPDKFPADMSMLTGLVTEEEFREERGDYYERLRREGTLEALRRSVPRRRNLWLVTAGSLAVLALGLSLLLAIITA